MPDQPKHTPGTMFIKRAGHPVDGAFDCGLCIHFHGRDYVVAETFGRVDVNELTPAEANARRIAACWNVLEGLNIELLEQIASIDHPVARLAALSESTDRIGRETLTTIITTQGEAAADAVIAEAHAAIAKATTQPNELRDDERAEVLKSASSV